MKIATLISILFLTGCVYQVDSNDLIRAANHCGGFSKIHSIEIAPVQHNTSCKLAIKNETKTDTP